MNKASVTKEGFGKTSKGTLTEKYVLLGTGGLEVSLLNYGATIQAIKFEGKDIVLGYDDIIGYEKNDGFIGATIGRFGNRIAEGRFKLNGITYDVGKNENDINQLHGGVEGFDKKFWDVEILDQKTPGVKMSYLSKDLEEGFPGNLKVDVIFSVLADNSLEISYKAVSDKDTVVNFTNHSYFNLNGFNGGNILETQLQIFSDKITPVNKKLIPTGEILSAQGTPFDFRESKEIGRDIENENDQLKIGAGYDHNFILGGDMKMREAAAAYSHDSGIEMECFTDQPGLQLYTGQFMTAKRGKDSKPIKALSGFCLETQHFPNSPNEPNFPSTTLKKGEVFKSTTVYKFALKNKC